MKDSKEWYFSKADAIGKYKGKLEINGVVRGEMTR